MVAPTRSLIKRGTEESDDDFEATSHERDLLCGEGGMGVCEDQSSHRTKTPSPSTNLFIFF